MKINPLRLYAVGVSLALAGALWLRRDMLLDSPKPSGLDLLLVGALLALLLSPFYREVTFGGVTLKREIREAHQDLSSKIGHLHAAVVGNVAVSPTFNVQLHQLVQQEVSRAHLDALALMAAIDKQMIPIWERRNSLTPGDSNAQLLDLLASQIRDLEDRIDRAPAEEKAPYGWVLRDLYWRWLEAAAKHWGTAGEDYARVHDAVMGRLERIACFRQQPGA